MKKQILTALLALTMVLSCFAFPAAATETAPKTLKVLAIGNSYSVDAMTYIYDIAKAHGVEEVVLGNLYIGGCELNTHWNNAKNNKAAYNYFKNDSGTWVNNADATMLSGLQDEEWDIITIQQASVDSGSPKTYNNLDELVNYVDQNKTNPNAKLFWHMTWAYEKGHDGYSNLYDNDQEFMYRSICATVQSKILTRSDFTGVIPSGTAIQNVRKTLFGDKLNRDGTHLNATGRFIAGYTWYCALTGDRPQALKFTAIPDGVNPKNGEVQTKGCELTAEQSEAILQSVLAALDNPFSNCPPPHEVNAGEWFFFPNAPVAGELADGYVFGSDTVADGTRVTVSIPSKTETKYIADYAGHFWQADENGAIIRSSGSPLFGLHDVIAAADGSAITLANPADGSHGELGKCARNCTAIACGNADRSTECPVQLSLSDKLTIVDLRQDVCSGTEAAVTTVDAVKALCDEGKVVVNAYAPNGTATALLVLDHTYKVFRGDAFYFIDPVDKTKECKAIVLYSETLPLGISMVTPVNGSGSITTAHHFWEMMNVEKSPLKRFAGLWVSYTNKYIFGYHDVISAYDPDAKTVTLSVPADSHHNKATCPYAKANGYNLPGQFDESCGDPDPLTRSYECAAELALADDLKIYDLRGDVLAGLAPAAIDVAAIKTLCDEGKAIVNTYAPDGTKSDGTANAFIVIDAQPFQSRGEAVQALYEQVGKPAVTVDATFSDVTADSEYANAVSWAAETGLVSGYGDGSFGVNDNITLEQLAVMLWNKAAKPAAATAAVPESVTRSDWATSALNWCSETGVLEQVSFDKADFTATRTQIFQMVANYLNK